MRLELEPTVEPGEPLVRVGLRKEGGSVVVTLDGVFVLEFKSGTGRFHRCWLSGFEKRLGGKGVRLVSDPDSGHPIVEVV